MDADERKALKREINRLHKLVSERGAAVMEARAERDALRDAVRNLASDLESVASGVETTTVAGARFGKLRDVVRQIRTAIREEEA